MKEARTSEIGIEGYSRWIDRQRDVWLLEVPGLYVLHIWHRLSCRCSQNPDATREHACNCRWRVEDSPVLLGQAGAPCPLLLVRHMPPDCIIDAEGDIAYVEEALAMMMTQPKAGRMWAEDPDGSPIPIDREAMSRGWRP